MKRILVIVFAVAVVATACSPTTSTSTSTTEPTTPEPPTTSTTTTEVASADKDRVVVLSLDGTVSVYASDGELLTSIEPPDGSFYRSPTWLDASTLVFSESSEADDHALVAADAETGSIVWRAAVETPPFYFSPSPPGSSLATTSLRNNPVGAGLIAESIDRDGAVTRLSTESPFYTSWSPDGSQLAVHIAGVRMDVVVGSDVETILTSTGLFQAPIWTDEGLVTLRTEAGVQYLSIWDDAGFRDLATVEGPAVFVASGNRAVIQLSSDDTSGAIQTATHAQSIGEIPRGQLTMVDLESGTTTTVTRDTAISFQWDQSGSRLLYATIGSEQLSLIWHVWEPGTSMELAQFTPQPPWLSNFLPFFDQYAQSVNMWSASGDIIAYPAVVDSQAVVVLEAVGDGAQTVIDDATWASWAPRR